MPRDVGTDTQWLSTTEAARRLGVKPETLYAYVSRGMVRSFPGTGTRGSRFERGDIEALLARRRSNPGGSPETVVASRITRISENGVLYRGHRVETLVEHRYENVAELLWDTPATSGPWPSVPLRMPTLPGDTLLADRLRIAIAVSALEDPGRHDLRAESTVVSARQMIASVVSALPAGGATPTLTLAGRRHRDSIAALLATRLGAPKPNPALTRAVNTALVLLADHELATSTFAARLAASTRADVYSAVAAGAACGGPLHVGASRDVTRLFRRAEEIGPRRAVTEELSAGRHLAGFGHKIYAKDPRHDPFFELVRTAGFSGRRLTLVEEVLELGRARVPVEPNVDFAGAALTYCAGLRDDAAEAIFLVARMAGWIAHAREEFEESPLRFRARGLYVGVPTRSSARNNRRSFH